MKAIYSKILIVLVMFVFSNSLLGQTTRFFIGMGGEANHSFPHHGRYNDILHYEDISSKTYFLEPNYELTVGISFADRFDLLVGINSGIRYLYSSPLQYELSFHQINYPIRFRYHWGNSQAFSNFFMVGLYKGKILQQKLSQDASTWHYYYLEGRNHESPFCLEFGGGRSFTITEKSNLVLNPFISYEVSKNEILKEFFNPITIGIKVSFEFKLK